jgi:cell division protease FtsH
MHFANYIMGFLPLFTNPSSTNYLNTIDKPPARPYDENPYLSGLEISRIRMLRRPWGAKRREYLRRSSNHTTSEFPIQRIMIPIIDLADITHQKPREHRQAPATVRKTSGDGNFYIDIRDEQFGFADVGGYVDVKLELLQVVDFLRNASTYSQYGVRVCKGILLNGPPGTGKTRLAKALAGECNVSFIPTVGSVFHQKYVGIGSARMRELFDFASQNKPAIVFIDELDAIGRKRSGGNEGSDGERDSTLNQLLVYLDGFESDAEVVVLAATNRVDILDEALIRSGRFDKIITVPNPDKETRDEIVKIHMGNKPINVSIDDISSMTAGFSGAQIEALMNEATLYSIRNQSLPVNVEALEIMKDRILLGQSTKKRNVSTPILKRVAVHEVGHLLMSLKSPNYPKPIKVSIESTGASSFGHTMFEGSDQDEGFFLKEHLQDRIKVLLGGRAAEDVIYGDSSSGAVADLEQAFGVAKQMVLSFGMGRSIINPFFSESYKRKVDDDIHVIISTMYRETRKTLEENEGLIQHIANALVKSRVLKYPEIVSLMNEHRP